MTQKHISRTKQEKMLDCVEVATVYETVFRLALCY